MASSHIARITAGGVSDRRIAHSLYGYCTTAAATAAKTVNLYTGSSTTADGTWAAADLFHGLTIKVRFQYSNTVANPTLNVNGTGAKTIYRYGTTAPSTTTITSWYAQEVATFTYDTLLASTGCWVMSSGYRLGNDNTVGYQLRTNSSNLPVTDQTYRYRLLFTSPDGSHFIPSTTSTSTDATASRNVNQRPIDPFGEIVYYATTTVLSAEDSPGAANLWQQYSLYLGYSFNRTGAALVLTYPAPVYIKCTPQPDGSAIIDADTPYVQTLPTQKDGKIYIFLGVAYNATAIELKMNHPVYHHDGKGIRLWTGKQYTELSVTIASATPASGNKEGDICFLTD